MKRAICRTTHSVVWPQVSCICSYDRRHGGLAKMAKIGMPVIPTKPLRIALFIAYGNLCGEPYGCITNWSCALWYYKGAYNGRMNNAMCLPKSSSTHEVICRRSEKKVSSSSPALGALVRRCSASKELLMTLRGILLLSCIFLVGFYGFYEFFRVDETNSLILNDVAIRCNHIAIYVAKRKNDQYQ